MKRVETTKIEKKWKDRKTGEQRSVTMNYAKVIDRVNAFWEDNPRGRIHTSSKKDGDEVIFKTHILVDKADEYSKEATGHAYGKIGDEKAFEKLETISLGRALALLGYAVTGAIASSEEMEEFERYQKDQKEEYTQSQLELIEKCKSLDDLKLFWSQTDKTNLVILDAKDAKKAELLNDN